MKKNILLRTNVTICLIIIIGFITVSTIINNSNLEMLEKDIEQVSKLSSESIYSNIAFMLEKPISVSTTMANDNFLKIWLISEQEHNNPEQLQEYLLAYKEKYNYDSIFLVSAASSIYYHYNGIDRILNENNPEDIWYYSFLEHNQDYCLEVDNDQANHDLITIFVNCRIKDSNGKILGVVGVGLKTEEVQSLLNEYEQQFNVQSYLFDASGLVQVSAKETKFANIDLFNSAPYSSWAEKILANKTSKESFWYPQGEINGYYVIQYVPNLDWYLAVIKDTKNIHELFTIQRYQQIIFVVFTIFALLVLVTKVIKNFNTQIMHLSTNDALTGVRNRHSYEGIIASYNNKLKHYQSIAIGIFDLNDLKSVNDNYGHRAGDLYIQDCTNIICNSFPNNAIFRIGGDEFACIFIEMTDEEINRLYQNLEKALDNFNQGKKIYHSIAFGYDFFDAEKDKNLESVFARADAKMYKNKKEYKKLVTMKMIKQ